MNKKLLRAEMIMHGQTYDDLAKYLGISASTLSKKINEKSGIGFTQPEIIKIKNLYNLDADKVDKIFFEA